MKPFKLFLTLIINLLIIFLSNAQIGTVLSYSKISSTFGNFSGTLDSDDGFGRAISIGDFDGDNINDIAVPASGDDDGGSNRGAVWLLMLNEDKTVKNYYKISSTSGGFGIGLDNEDIFGAYVCNLGDIDGDAVTDIAVSAWGDDDGGTNTGAVWIIFLNSNGTVKNKQKISALEGNFIGDLDAVDMFGITVSSLGDLDDDGITDIGVSARDDDDGGTDRGAVWILYLYSNGTVKTHSKISNTSGGFYGQLDDYDWFGRGLAKIEDLNGDGINEFVIGSMQDDDGGTDKGAIWILFMNSDETVNYYQKISATQGNFNGVLDAGDNFGRSICNIGDIDNDGICDIVAGAYDDDDGATNAGAFWVLLLNSDGTVKDYQKISSLFGGFTGILDAGDYFGVSVELYLANTNSFEVLVGAVSDDDGQSGAGAVWILTIGNLETPTVEIIQTCENNSILLTAQINLNCSILWSTGDTSLSIIVPNVENSYSVIASIDGNNATDSIYIKDSLQTFNDLLILSLPFNGNAIDESGNGNNGIIENGTTLTTNRFGEENKAYFFDGIDDYILITPITDVSEIGDFTISLWAYCEGWENQPGLSIGYLDHQYIFDGHSRSGTVTSDFFRDGIHVDYNQKTDYHETTYNVTRDLETNSFVNEFDFANDLLFKWHNLVFIRKNDSTYHYFDGNLISVKLNNNSLLNMQHDWHIGTFSANNHNYSSMNYNFFGKIDDILFYNKALNNCEVQNLFNQNSTIPNIGIVNNDTTICTGSSIILRANENSTYTYLWNTSETTASISVSPIETTEYFLTITNGANIFVDSITVNISPNPVVNLGGDFSQCEGNPIVLDAGNDGTYNWQDNSINQTFSVTQTGLYSVTVTNLYGCSDSDSVLISILSTPSVTILGNPYFCTTNTTMLTAEGGDLGASYHWSNGSDLAEITVSIGGVYSVTVINSNGCEDENFVTVVESLNPIVNLGDDFSQCEGNPIVLDAGNDGTYNWQDNSINQTFSVTQTGLYSVTVTNLYGCETSDNIFVTINQLPSSPIENTNITFEQDVDTVITLNADNGENNMAYFWEETNDTSKTIIVSTNGIFNTLNYNVIIENKNTGCSITITYTITKAQMDIHPYNVITANDDGYNDYWEIDNIVLYPESTVIIFNRNGNTVYGPQKDYENSTKFDGTYNNKHLPAATYFYIIDLSKYSKKQIRGSLTILR